MSTEINIKKRIDIQEEGVSITPDVNSINFTGAGVTASATGNDVTVDITAAAGSVLYYMNETVTQAPYKEFSSIGTIAAEQVVPATVAGGATATIASYQTPSGIPGSIVIPQGLWQLFLHFNAGSAGQNWIIRPLVYKRDLGGIETLLFSIDPITVTNMSTVTTLYTTESVVPNTILLATDRIVVKIDLENTRGVSQTANFRTEGSQHYSCATTTLNQAVPTGAVTSVTGTAPIASSGGTTPAISIPQSSATVAGYLSSSDWSVFNAKQNAITLTTIGTSGAATLISNTLNIPTPSSVNIYNSSGVLTGTRTVDLSGFGINFTDSIGTSYVNFGIDDGGGDYSSFYQTLGGFNLTAGTGSFSKSFYVDNLGVGIYASGTGGRYTFPNVQPTVNQIPYAVSAAQLGFTSVKTINGNSILGSGDIVVSAANGKWGIANASGIYTYYATYPLAYAVAVAGQTIEMFGSQTESTANHILKPNVNINYNGYTLTFTSGFGIIDNNVACEVQLLNGEIKKGVAGQIAITITNSGTIIRGNVLVNSSLAGGGGTGSFGLYGPATVYGLQFKGNDPLNLYSASVKGKAYGVTINCTGGTALAYGEVYNSVINSTSVSASYAIQYVTVVNNCSGVINGNISFYMQGTSIRNSSFTNLTSITCAYASQDDNFIDTCYFRCSGDVFGSGNGQGKGLISNTKISGFSYLWKFDSNICNMDKCVLISDTSYNFYLSYGATFNFCTFIVRDSSNSFQDLISGTIKLNNCNFQLFNVAAYPVYGGSAKNFTASNNTYNTTNFQLNMTNLQTYTADAVGNQRLN